MKNKRRRVTRIIGLLTVLCAALFFSVSCNSAEAAEFKTDKMNIAASLFPQYDFARTIAGERAYVHLILPPGSETHTFDPRPGDIVKINNSDIFLYTGGEMEPWAERLAEAAENVTVVDCSAGIELLESGGLRHDDSAAAEESIHEHEHSADPHFWLDFSKAAQMAESICGAMCEADPDNADYYRQNADALIESLLLLDAETAALVAGAKRDAVVFGDRFAYIYFLTRYNLNYVSAYDSCSSEAEPGMQKILEVVKFIKENKIPCVYYAELSQAKTAATIAEESGAEKLLFSTGHNITKQEFDDGATFLDVMYGNLENLKIGLN